MGHLVDVSDAIALGALFVSGIAALYARSSTKHAATAASVAKDQYLEGIRPRLIAAPPGSQAARLEGPGAILDSAFSQGKVDIQGAGQIVLAGGAGFGLYSVLIHNAGNGTAVLTSARLLLTGRERQPCETARLIGVLARYIPPGGYWRASFIDEANSIPQGHVFAGVTIEIAYENSDGSEGFKSFIDIGLGRHSGHGILAGEEIEPYPTDRLKGLVV